jgi:hypothetical protein
MWMWEEHFAVDDGSGQLGVTIASDSTAYSEEFMSELKKDYIAFEKRHGSKGLIEDCIIAQRRKGINYIPNNSSSSVTEYSPPSYNTHSGIFLNATLPAIR